MTSLWKIVIKEHIHRAYSSLEVINLLLLCIILSPQFTETHLAQANTSFLFLDTSKNTNTSETFYLVELEECLDLDFGHCCEFKEDYYKKKCDNCWKNIKFFTLLKIQKGLGMLKKEFRIANSCNGLLCLANTIGYLCNDTEAVCNPITGDFIYLPRPEITPLENILYFLG